MAGLKRLGLEDRADRILEPDEMLPAAGQGILAIQGRAGEDYSFLEEIDDEDSRAEALAERAFIKVLQGGCVLRRLHMQKWMQRHRPFGLEECIVRKKECLI